MRLLKVSRGLVAKVDNQDYAKLMKFEWHAVSNKGLFYAATNICVGVLGRRRQSGDRPTQRKIKMHHMILPRRSGMDLDHVNGNELDNRRKNLRYVTHSQNLCRQRKRKGCSSRYKGVMYRSDSGVWRAYISHESIGRIWLGQFSTEREAALVYNEAAKQYHGQFARLNMVAA